MKNKVTELIPEYVEFMPDKEDMSPYLLYISKTFETAIHLCACGCKEQVVTPIDEGNWSLEESEDMVSLHPSIGNRFACKSHYWIKNNKIIWC